MSQLVNWSTDGVEMKRAVVIVVLVVVILLAARAMMGGKANGAPGALPAAPKEERAIPVEVATVQRGSMTRTLSVTGSLRSDEDVQISSKLMGKVVAVFAQEGDRVPRGKLLVQLDDREILAQWQQAKAALRAAEARYAQARDSEPMKYVAVDADIARAEEGVRAAKARLNQALTGTTLTSAQTDTEVKRAEAMLASARANLANIKRGAREQQRRMAAAEVERAQAGVQHAEDLVRTAESAVRQAEINLRDAHLNLNRAKMLFKDGAIAQADLDLAQVRYDNAVATLEAAKAQRDAAKSQRDTAKAALAAAQQSQSLTEEGPTTEEIRMAEEAVRQSEALLEAAQANVARKQVSAEDVEAARTAVRQAEEMLKVARANKAQYKLVKDDIRAAAAAVHQARAQVAYAEEQLRQTRIFSPVSGVVVQRTVNVGETVAPGAMLMRIVALDTVYYEAQVSELDAPEVRPGLPVKVTVDALPNRTIPAVVREVIPVAERESKQFRVRISVENRNGDLPPGGFARGVIEVGLRRNVLLVPKATLYTEAGETFVYLIADGRAQRQTVKVGLRDEKHAEILSGLQEGQQIVAGGFVTEGAKVQPVSKR